MKEKEEKVEEEIERQKGEGKRRVEGGGGRGGKER